MWEGDPRVTILSTENHGVSHARNLGLQQAAGEWIMFLDSDDYLLPDCLEKLMAMVSPDSQEVLAAYAGDETQTGKPMHQAVRADAVRTMTLDPINNRLLPAFYEAKPLSLSSCWAKLFRGDVIRKHALRFREDLRLSEDTLFHLDYLACIDHVVVTNLRVVYYRQNAASVTRVFQAAQLENRFRFFHILKERQEPDAAVHILSLLFFDACKIERYTYGRERRLLEREIIRYLADNPDILRSAKDRSLSEGRWQKTAYQAAAVCFRRKAYRAGFALLRAYAAATRGEINRLTTNE